MGTERCWAAQLARFAPESGSGVPGLSACTSFYLQQPPEFHLRVIKLPLTKGETRKPGEGSLVGLGGSPSIRMGTHWEGLEGKSLQPEEFSGGARYKYHSEVGLAIKADCTSPHLSCWGGKPTRQFCYGLFLPCSQVL